MKTMLLVNPKRRKRSSTMKKRARKTSSTGRRRTRRNPTTKRTTSITRRNPVAVKGRRRRSSAPAKRRRSTRRNPSRATLKGIMNQETWMLAGAAVGGTALWKWVMESWRGTLPGTGQIAGQVAYRVGVPFAAGFAVNQFGGSKWKPVANGLVIGGLILGINRIIDWATPNGNGSKGTGAYYDGVGEYFPAPASTRGMSAFPTGTPSYQATNVFNGVGGPYTPNSAYAADAWG